MSDSSAQSFRAVGLGEVLWDLLPAGKQLGGAPANFAYHAQQLGARASVASAVGRDNPGTEILHRLRDLGLDTSCVNIEARHPTGSVSVTLDAAGVPTYTIHDNVAWDFVRQSPALTQLAQQTDVVCFGSLAQRSETSRATIRAFLAAMPQQSLRIFDINLRQGFYDASLIEQSLQAANVLKLNDEELPIVVDLLQVMARPIDDPLTPCAILLERFDLQMVALTRGEKGSLLINNEQRSSSHPGVKPAQIVDTVGAGDAFTAAVAIGLLLHKPLDEINAVANRRASYVCTQPGATPPVPRELGYDVDVNR